MRTKANMWLTIFLMGLSLLGCASHSDRASSRQACIKGQQPTGLFDYFSKSNSHVEVIYLPLQARALYGYRCLEPGIQRLLVSVARGPGLGANSVIVIRLEEGHNYQVRATFESGLYRVDIFDATGGMETNYRTFDLPEGYYGYNILLDKATGNPIDLVNGSNESDPSLSAI